MSLSTPQLTLPPGPLWMVDDEAELVQATVAMLSRELTTTQVRGSTDPREVAGWIDREKPAVLITDVRMPHVTGLELVTKLHEKWGPVPVVVMTAYPTAQVDENARAGRFAYLPKPFTFRALRDTLSRICSRPAAPSAFSGAIAVSMLDEVVQLYGLANRTGTLRVISGERVGDIAFDSGRVVDARAAGLSGIPAFNEILCWTSGSFGWDARPPSAHTIQLGLSELLLEAYRLRDEQSPLAGSGPDDADPFPELREEPGPEAHVPEVAPPVADNVLQNLHALQRADGFLGAAVFDAERAACVASVDRTSDSRLSDALAGHWEMLSAKRRTIAALHLDDEVEDIIISLRREYHLVRLCRRQPSVFVYLALDRAEANLAMARHLLANVEKDLVL